MPVSTTPIEMKPVASNKLSEIGHDATTNTLALRFKNKTGPGALYHYANVTPDDFAALEGAESLGRHVNQFIVPNKDRHPFVRIEEADPVPNTETQQAMRDVQAGNVTPIDSIADVREKLEKYCDE